MVLTTLKSHIKDLNVQDSLKGVFFDQPSITITDTECLKGMSVTNDICYQEINKEIRGDGRESRNTST